MKSKKFLSLLLSFAMLFTTAPLTAFADDTSPVLAAEVNITAQEDGAAEDSGVNTQNSNPTVQLSAYTAEEKTAAEWESADDTIAPIDENGLVADKGIGSTIIAETDGEEDKDGIKTVSESEDTPYFESLEFSTSSLVSGAWVRGETFVPEKLTYDLPIRTYSVSSLALLATTVYDTDKYTAVAEYTDVNGNEQSVFVNSGKMTTLANQPFDDSALTITIADKNNFENKTVYIFNVSRPRDTTKAVKSSGIVLVPSKRALSAASYKGAVEGTMQKADENGEPTSGAGVSGTQYYYRTFIYDDAESFKLNIASSTAYAHIRYSADGGESWAETAQGGGVTNEIALPESGSAEVLIRIIDDAAYAENIKSGKDGFAESEPAEYKVWVDKVQLLAPEILTAETNDGDWYSPFGSDMYSYWIVIQNNAEAPVLTYTVTEGSTVKVGTAEQTADENGSYTLTLGTSQSSITVTSNDGNYTSTYKIGYKKKSALDVPDKVVDYLCIGSHYTNAASFGAYPEFTLSGSLKSLGNFGGYITYYYEDPITDNPNNMYGMDFYITGNPSSETDSFAEPGQVYVSEDGDTWYALAGADHYENTAIWDYTITYTKGDDGKSYWTDNFGNAMDYAAKAWPGAAYYYMNDIARQDSYTFTGVLLKSQLGNIMGDGTTAAFAAKPKFGYTDCYTSNISGTTLKDVNPYVENPTKANGFDLAWAVDENGIPVNVSGKEFHYIKVATASNIYAGIFGEKSTEVTYVVRTTAQDEAVGKTTAPAGVTISDGADSKTVNFEENRTVYSLNLGDMKYVSVKVNGTADDDNIYVNNQRVASGIAAEGFKVTEENGETLVRVIIQNGIKEPVIYLLKLTGSAKESNELIEGIKINADGTVRAAATKNGTDYTASVGYKISGISVTPVAAGNVCVTVNGEEIADIYDLNYGSNVFEIAAVDSDGNSQNVTLTVTRENAPASTGKNITVKFALYGDEKHGDSEIHTYKNDKSKLEKWIPQKSYTVDSGATVLDVFEKALTEANLTWKNDSGNYISEIDGLAEFDNGPLSGWMYLLNGTHTNLGVAEQTVRSGDTIVFHYTDDYTQEQGSEKWTSSASGSAVSDYTVKFETNGGNTISSQSITKNGTVTKPSNPVKEGYIFDGWYSDRALTTEYDFSVKVTADFTLYAKWLESEISKPNDNSKNTSVFADVEKGAWYEEAVAYAVENNLFSGVSETEFAPNAGMTRAMLVTVLYRLEKPENISGQIRFSDIAHGKWYTDAVIWAAENGIVNGIGETEFAPDDNITREQMAAVIYRYAKMKGKAGEGEWSMLIDYNDINDISDWAKEAVMFCKLKGIMTGDDTNAFNPRSAATRAETAAIAQRFMENLCEN